MLLAESVACSVLVGKAGKRLVPVHVDLYRHCWRFTIKYLDWLLLWSSHMKHTRSLIQNTWLLTDWLNSSRETEIWRIRTLNLTAAASNLSSKKTRHSMTWFILTTRSSEKSRFVNDSCSSAESRKRELEGINSSRPPAVFTLMFQSVQLMC